MTDLEKLRKLTNQIDEMMNKRIDPSSEEFIAWKTKTERLLGRIFGENSKEHKAFRNAHFSSLMYISGMSEAEMRSHDIESCMSSLKLVRAKFKVYIEELEEDEDLPAEFEEENMVTHDYTKIFIVHGHDGELKVKVARLLEK